MSAVFSNLELIDTIAALEASRNLFPDDEWRGNRNLPSLTFKSDNTKYTFYTSSNKLLTQGKAEVANLTKTVLTDKIGYIWPDECNKKKRNRNQSSSSNQDTLCATRCSPTSTPDELENFKRDLYPFIINWKPAIKTNIPTPSQNKNQPTDDTDANI